MPAKSKAQLRAMYAAASGHSTLGIPQSVGQEFIAKTPKAKKSRLMQEPSMADQMRSHLTKSGRLKRAL